MYSSETSESTEPKIPEVPEIVLEAVKRRISEFESLGKNGFVRFDFKPFLDLEIEATLETELAFCISTANSSAKSGLKFQKSLEGFDTSKLCVEKLEKLLKEAGVRFYKKKAIYIQKSLEKFSRVEKLENLDRELLIAEFYGLGMKEASHFLRNTGRKEFAILDRHILRWLGEQGSITKKKYLEAERRMQEVAKACGVSVAELDLLVWFLKTKMVLK